MIFRVKIYESMITFGEYESIWKGSIVAYFEVISLHSSSLWYVLRKTTTNLSQDRQCPGLDTK